MSNKTQIYYLRNKKYKIIIIAGAILLLAIILCVIIVSNIKERKEDEVALTLKNNLTTEFLSEVYVSTFIENLNGTLTSDDKIDTTSLGTKTIEVKYKNQRGKKKHKTYEITVVDTEKPKIFLSDSTISVKQGYNKEIANLFLNGDNCDPTPERKIIGEYDLNTPGSYELTFEITDASGNKASKDFTLKVKAIKNGSAKTNTNINDNTKTARNKKHFSEILNKYCTNTTNTMSTENTENIANTEGGGINTTNNTSINYKSAGIDVSSWQGDINWKKVKNAGCDFAFIRVGSQYGRNGEINEDKYFKTNIENAIANNIKVGVYLYSCAQSTEEAQNQAKWVIDKIKSYKLSLPIVFDWEEWNSFADYNLSFYGINTVAKAFINECKSSGYAGMLYSSKNYLTNIWESEMFENIWLAQYASTPTYMKDYNYWQMCNTGRIDGITGDVDIDLLK